MIAEGTHAIAYNNRVHVDLLNIFRRFYSQLPPFAPMSRPFVHMDRRFAERPVEAPG